MSDSDKHKSRQRNINSGSTTRLQGVVPLENINIDKKKRLNDTRSPVDNGHNIQTFEPNAVRDTRLTQRKKVLENQQTTKVIPSTTRLDKMDQKEKQEHKKSQTSYNLTASQKISKAFGGSGIGTSSRYSTLLKQFDSTGKSSEQNTEQQNNEETITKYTKKVKEAHEVGIINDIIRLINQTINNKSYDDKQDLQKLLKLKKQLELNKGQSDPNKLNNIVGLLNILPKTKAREVRCNTDNALSESKGKEEVYIPLNNKANGIYGSTFGGHLWAKYDGKNITGLFLNGNDYNGDKATYMIPLEDYMKYYVANKKNISKLSNLTTRGFTGHSDLDKIATQIKAEEEALNNPKQPAQVEIITPTEEFKIQPQASISVNAPVKINTQLDNNPNYFTTVKQGQNQVDETIDTKGTTDEEPRQDGTKKPEEQSEEQSTQLREILQTKIDATQHTVTDLKNIDTPDTKLTSVNIQGIDENMSIDQLDIPKPEAEDKSKTNDNPPSPPEDEPPSSGEDDGDPEEEEDIEEITGLVEHNDTDTVEVDTKETEITSTYKLEIDPNVGLEQNQAVLSLDASSIVSSQEGEEDEDEGEGEDGDGDEKAKQKVQEQSLKQYNNVLVASTVVRDIRNIYMTERARRNQAVDEEILQYDEACYSTASELMELEAKGLSKEEYEAEKKKILENRLNELKESEQIEGLTNPKTFEENVEKRKKILQEMAAEYLAKSLETEGVTVSNTIDIQSILGGTNQGGVVTVNGAPVPQGGVSIQGVIPNQGGMFPQDFVPNSMGNPELNPELLNELIPVPNSTDDQATNEEIQKVKDSLTPQDKSTIESMERIGIHPQYALIPINTVAFLVAALVPGVGFLAMTGALIADLKILPKFPKVSTRPIVKQATNPKSKDEQDPEAKNPKDQPLDQQQPQQQSQNAVPAANQFPNPDLAAQFAQYYGQGMGLQQGMQYGMGVAPVINNFININIGANALKTVKKNKKQTEVIAFKQTKETKNKTKYNFKYKTLGEGDNKRVFIDYIPGSGFTKDFKDAKGNYLTELKPGNIGKLAELLAAQTGEKPEDVLNFLQEKTGIKYDVEAEKKLEEEQKQKEEAEKKLEEEQKQKEEAEKQKQKEEQQKQDDPNKEIDECKKEIQKKIKILQGRINEKTRALNTDLENVIKPNGIKTDGNSITDVEHDSLVQIAMDKIEAKLTGFEEVLETETNPKKLDEIYTQLLNIEYNNKYGLNDGLKDKTKIDELNKKLAEQGEKVKKWNEQITEQTGTIAEAQKKLDKEVNNKTEKIRDYEINLNKQKEDIENQIKTLTATIEAQTEQQGKVTKQVTDKTREIKEQKTALQSKLNELYSSNYQKKSFKPSTITVGNGTFELNEGNKQQIIDAIIEKETLGLDTKIKEDAKTAVNAETDAKLQEVTNRILAERKKIDEQSKPENYYSYVAVSINDIKKEERGNFEVKNEFILIKNNEDLEKVKKALEDNRKLEGIEEQLEDQKRKNTQTQTTIGDNIKKAKEDIEGKITINGKDFIVKLDEKGDIINREHFEKFKQGLINVLATSKLNELTQTLRQDVEDKVNRQLEEEKQNKEKFNLEQTKNENAFNGEKSQQRKDLQDKITKLDEQLNQLNPLTQQLGQQKTILDKNKEKLSKLQEEIGEVNTKLENIPTLMQNLKEKQKEEQKKIDDARSSLQGKQEQLAKAKEQMEENRRKIGQYITQAMEQEKQKQIEDMQAKLEKAEEEKRKKEERIKKEQEKERKKQEEQNIKQETINKAIDKVFNTKKTTEVVEPEQSVLLSKQMEVVGSIDKDQEDIKEKYEAFKSVTVVLEEVENQSKQFIQQVRGIDKKVTQVGQ